MIWLTPHHMSNLSLLLLTEVDTLRSITYDTLVAGCIILFRFNMVLWIKKTYKYPTLSIVLTS